MEQADQTQKGLIPVTPLSGYPHPQDSESLSILAFIEYVQAFRDAIGKNELPAFDTGEYYVGREDVTGAIYCFVILLNESLRKKTVARLGKKLMSRGQIQSLMQSISSYLGFYNIAIADYVQTFSLAHLLDERPSGFLEPLTDAEWQALSEKAVEEMLKRRQHTAGSRSANYDEIATDFSDRRHDISCHFRGAARKYPFANDEAKRAAQAIVATEKVRLTLFLEALGGTLRFFNRLTRLPQYREVQLPFDVEYNRSVDAEKLIVLLNTFIGEDDSMQEEPEQKSSKKIRIVEGEIGLPATVTLHLRKEEHIGNMHIYHLSLTDSRNLSEPVPFLLRVEEGGDAELFEDESDG